MKKLSVLSWSLSLMLAAALVGALAAPEARAAREGAGPAPPSIASRISRSKVSGIDVLVYPTQIKDVVTIVGALPAGDAFAAKGNVAVATLTGMMLDRGTTRQDKFQISEKLENAGATIGFDVESQTVGVRGRSLRKDLPMVIGLIAEQLRTPAFSSEEFEKARREFIGNVQNLTENVNFRARDAFERAVFPEGNPNRQPTIDEYLKAAQTATLDEVKAFHRVHYGPARLLLVFVGDVDPAAVRREIAKGFAGWQGGVDYIRPAAPLASRAGEATVPLRDKPSVSIVLGQPTGLQYRDDGALALRIGAAILGSGFTGRLMSSVRDREGLTYGIGAGVSNDTFTDGTFAVSATFAPDLLEKGLASTRRELEKWWRDGVTEQELAARKENIIGTYQVGLSTTSGLAGAILTAIQRGYGMSWLDEFPKAVDRLTVQQVNDAIRKHVDPQKMVLVKAGSL